jgi:hypothetical protein
MIDLIVERTIMTLVWLIHVLQPAIVPVCFVAAWILLLMAGWSTVSFMRDGVSRAKKMHKIPCTTCQYFTENYHLKCPVHPSIALSEAAINCRDYEERSIGFYS